MRHKLQGDTMNIKYNPLELQQEDIDRAVTFKLLGYVLLDKQVYKELCKLAILGYPHHLSAALGESDDH